MQFIIENFDWGHAAKSTLVDIGSGKGGIAIQIANFLLRISCVIQDLPEVILGVDSGERVRFIAHDFFQEQLVKDADIYFLRRILHDWSDKYITKILQNLIPALKKGSRVLISDMCLPEPCSQSLYKQRYARSYDLNIKGIQNAKERDARDWAELFKTADSRFKFQGVETLISFTLLIINIL
ncbi:O-methyltransferase fsr2 [Lachnellula suecica]|uniref:O-methyltransferase fsr2 n=1 Tax=Lachnellula suecica TaxID=602035 RepID=A0A8T9BUU7_9HELO|nr:O-methyltransferase fsr2 [Lachnellula suecica]